MLTSLLPGIRDLRAPLAAGYIWLLFGWLVLQPRYDALDKSSALYTAMSSLIQELSSAGVAVAASFAAYLVGSLSFALMEAGYRLASMRDPWRVNYDQPKALRGKMDGTPVPSEISGYSRFSRYKNLSIRKSRDAEGAEGTEGAADAESSPALPDLYITLSVPRRSVAFNSVVEGWGKDLCRQLERVGVSEDLYWQALRTNLEEYPKEYSPFLTLLLALRVYQERELIADGLLDEKSELYGVIDRLRGEIELRDAILLPLLALTMLLAITNSLFWLLALAPIVGLGLHRWKLEQKRLDRILAAVSWKPTRAPILKRIERAVQPATKPASRPEAMSEDTSSLRLPPG